jgi:quinoprotein glucose dehydrogenase
VLAQGAVAEWPAYGGDQGGRRYSPLTQITPVNVNRLKAAWTYRTGDVSDGKGEIPSKTAFEGTPILVDGTLYFPTPFNRIIALDPETGAERWIYDPKIDLKGHYANQLVSRGVAHWHDSAAPDDGPCGARIFAATNDARLIALDARTGHPCADFGDAGIVDLKRGVGETQGSGEYQVTSPPAVAGDVVVVGSAVNDNQRIDAPSGVVRGYDARTGVLRWGWDLAPPDLPPDFKRAQWSGYVLGTPNVWAPMSVDEERGLVFVPTGNPAPDYYRGGREVMDFYGSSVVALRAATGEVVWNFQTVHHDLWDFDVPAQPTLATIRRDGEEIPVVIQATKMGLLFILHRETGEPVFGVEERPVPQNGAPGQRISPTQPFPVKPPSLIRQTMTPDDAWGVTFWDRGRCRERIAALRFDGMYTPPTLQGTLMFPGNAGGSNWGGIAVDPERQLIITNVINLAWKVALIPRDQYAASRAEHPGIEHGPQVGTPYGMRREMIVSPFGMPCTPPPWGTLAAVDLRSGDIRWQETLGTLRDLAPVPIPIKLGTPNLGGPLVTASGLIFIGAAMDNYLRAFDVQTGEELWKCRLPAGGQATPMTYTIRPGGKQYVVIAAGGHGRSGTTLGDHVVAYTLP